MIPQPTPEDIARDACLSYQWHGGHAHLDRIHQSAASWIRRAVAAETRIAELEAALQAITGINESDLDKLMERWDQTDPQLQRKIVVAFAGKRLSLEADLRRIRAAASHFKLCRRPDGNMPAVDDITADDILNGLTAWHDAIAAEREACAAIADGLSVDQTWLGDPSLGLTCAGRKIAAAIRARAAGGGKE